MTDQKHIDLTKKLLALADRGVGGEKEEARRRLSVLMEKYDVTEADLSDDVLDDYEFEYHGKFQKKILIQVFYKVNHERETLRYVHGKGKNTVRIFRATAAEAMQARIMYEFYCDLWEEEADFFMECFIQKHRIFRDDPDAPSTEVDKEKCFRTGFIMEGMKDKDIRQRLAAGT